MQPSGVDVDPGKVDEILGLHATDPSSLIMVLQDIQKEFSFLPSLALQRVSETLGVPIDSIYQSLQIYLGGLQVNDLTLFGRTYKVMAQAEPEFRVDWVRARASGYPAVL